MAINISRLIVLFIFLLSFNASAQSTIRDAYEGGDYYGLIRPFKVPKVKSVAIEKNGAWSDQYNASTETARECVKFKLKKRDVHEFFKYARRVSYKEYWNDLNFSKCHATGRVLFENGDAGQWTIEAFRKGVLSLSDGRNVYFYCTKCTGKAFYEYE